MLFLFHFVLLSCFLVICRYWKAIIKLLFLLIYKAYIFMPVKNGSSFQMTPAWLSGTYTCSVGSDDDLSRLALNGQGCFHFCFYVIGNIPGFC